jgi:hypothetical protein
MKAVGERAAPLRFAVRGDEGNAEPKRQGGGSVPVRSFKPGWIAPPTWDPRP